MAITPSLPYLCVVGGSYVGEDDQSTNLDHFTTSNTSSQAATPPNNSHKDSTAASASCSSTSTRTSSTSSPSHASPSPPKLTPTRPLSRTSLVLSATVRQGPRVLCKPAYRESHPRHCISIEGSCSMASERRVCHMPFSSLPQAQSHLHRRICPAWRSSTA